VGGRSHPSSTIGSSVTRLSYSLARLFSRPLKRSRKSFISGKPQTFMLAKLRQRGAEDYFSRRYLNQLSPFFHSANPAGWPSLIFSHVPKCGGTSIHYWLKSELGMAKLNSPGLMRDFLARKEKLDAVSFGHLNVDHCVQLGLFPAEALNSAESFALVRNPFTRVLSLYSHFKVNNHLPDWWSLDQFLELLLRSEPNIGLYNLARFSQAAPQVSWLKQCNWRGPRRVLAIEHPGEVDAYLQQFGVLSKFGRTRASGSSRYIERWSDRTTQLAVDLYYEDFEFLGYSPEALPFT